MANILKNVIATAKPNLATFLKYAKVELVPPTPGEIGQVGAGIKNIISSAKSGKWKTLTVREAWLNALVTCEVLCWFYVGEVIGKRNLVGYRVEV
ncbi:ATP synthase [Nesidiocoris tenuis]|uniref:ATP synthase subunit g n=1 Tax=Nesidiocoris tenuis TaxID=355587 RepID=A0ABN7B6S2_9HEMI|nr:ATP synthase [Nesidiocoris tenuis]